MSGQVAHTPKCYWSDAHLHARELSLQRNLLSFGLLQGLERVRCVEWSTSRCIRSFETLACHDFQSELPPVPRVTTEEFKWPSCHKAEDSSPWSAGAHRA